MSRSRRSVLLVLPLIALTAACGTTVRLDGQPAGNEVGLGQPLGSAPTRGAAPLVTAGPVGTRGPTGVVPGPGTGPGTTPVGAGPSTAPPTAAGAPDRSPITLGLMDVGDTSGFVSSFGFSSSSSAATGQQLMLTLVKWYNAHGGIAQRKIKVVEHTASATSASYDTEFSAACARFTQDNHVAAVLTQTGYQVSENYETCLSKAGVPNVNGSIGGFDDGARTRHPLLFSTSSASIDRSLVAELTGLTRSGFLTKQTKLGVIVETCPQNVYAYDRTLKPLAAKLGLQVTRRDIDCVAGNGNLAQVISQVSGAALPFRAAGIDRVTFVSSYQGAATVFFEQQASSQGYKPWYALTSYAGVGAYASQVSADAQTRIKGVGWAPVADVSAPGAPTGATKRCRQAYASMQLVPHSAGEALAMDETCAQFFALEEALLATNGHSDAASLRRGLERSSSSPLLLGGTRLSTTSRHDAPVLFAPFGFTASCSCFAYTGPPQKLAGE